MTKRALGCRQTLLARLAGNLESKLSDVNSLLITHRYLTCKSKIRVKYM